MPDNSSLTDGLNWLIAAVLLAMASIGPKIIGPLLDNWASSRRVRDLPPSAAPTPLHTKILGVSVADNMATGELAQAINRLCDILEKQYVMEEEQSQEMRMRQMMSDLLAKLPKGL